METYQLDILNEVLGKEVYQQIRFPDNYRLADPWRLYQKPSLLTRVAGYIVDFFKNKKIDVIASISDLGIPFAVSVAYEANKRGIFEGSMILLNPKARDDEEEWIFPDTLQNIQDKKILLTDEIVNTGRNTLRSMKYLREQGAKILGLIVLLDKVAEPEREMVNEVKNFAKEMNIPTIAICHSSMGMSI